MLGVLLGNGKSALGIGEMQCLVEWGSARPQHRTTCCMREGCAGGNLLGNGRCILGSGKCCAWSGAVRGPSTAQLAACGKAAPM